MGRNHEASHKNGELQRALLELPMRTPYHLRCPGWRPGGLSQHARSQPARTRAGGTTSLGRGQINLTDLSKTGFSSARQCRKLSKGHSVSIGRIGKLECDFFARWGDSYAYVQVSMTIASPEVERREYAPFGRIRDGWPRFLFTLDPLRSQRDGVRHLNLMEFLKANSDLF